MNDQAAVVAELRAIAQKIREAREVAATDADALKLLLRSYGDDASNMLKPVWPVLKSPLPWFKDCWLTVALPALRHCLDGAAGRGDGDAFKKVTTATYLDSVDGEIDCDWEHWELLEIDMTEPQRLKFYLKQSRSWSDLLTRFADLLVSDCVPLAKKRSRKQPDSPVTKWVRKHWHKYGHIKTKAVKAYMELENLPSTLFGSYYAQLNNDCRKNPLVRPKK